MDLNLIMFSLICLQSFPNTCTNCDPFKDSCEVAELKFNEKLEIILCWSQDANLRVQTMLWSQDAYPHVQTMLARNSSLWTGCRGDE